MPSNKGVKRKLLDDLEAGPSDKFQCQQKNSKNAQKSDADLDLNTDNRSRVRSKQSKSIAKTLIKSINNATTSKIVKNNKVVDKLKNQSVKITSNLMKMKVVLIIQTRGMKAKKKSRKVKTKKWQNYK